MAQKRKAAHTALERRVRAGLCKLAFGDIADAVRLLLTAEHGPEAAKGLDLFNVSELKYGKNGFEAKFFDRFRALEALARIAENDGRAAGVEPFFAALTGAAREEGEENNA